MNVGAKPEARQLGVIMNTNIVKKSDPEAVFGNTIAVIFDDRDDPMATESSPVISDVAMSEKSFRIRLADTDEGRSSASMLVNKMYAWRGYAGMHQIKDSPNRITLTASSQKAVVGTVTLSIDSPVGILADEIFKDEIDAHRSRGRKVCELTKLAFAPDVRSKIALASIFHIAFIYGRRIHQCTDVFIEVNPRHRLFYEKMLGFKAQGDLKLNPRVNAPACLLWLNLEHVEQQINRFGGQAKNSVNARSLYPFFFSAREEDGITQRLIRLD